jgi:hypothetical protein
MVISLCFKKIKMLTCCIPFSDNSYAANQVFMKMLRMTEAIDELSSEDEDLDVAVAYKAPAITEEDFIELSPKKINSLSNDEKLKIRKNTLSFCDKYIGNPNLAISKAKIKDMLGQKKGLKGIIDRYGLERISERVRTEITMGRRRQMTKTRKELFE